MWEQLCSDYKSTNKQKTSFRNQSPRTTNKHCHIVGWEIATKRLEIWMKQLNPTQEHIKSVVTKCIRNKEMP